MLYTYRLLRYWIFTLLPNHRHDAPFYERIWRKMCYKLLGWIRPLKHWGKMRFVYEMNPGNASMEMREEDFNRVVLYVEGYLADIANRYCEDAPNPMPPDRETRSHWGLSCLKGIAEKRRRKAENASNYRRERKRRGEDPLKNPDVIYVGRKNSLLNEAWRLKELGRIYRRLTEDQMENPYWDQFAGYSMGDELGYPSLPDHVDKDRQREISDKASRFDSVTRKRRAHMHEQLQEICSVMAYD